MREVVRTRFRVPMSDHRSAAALISLLVALALSACGSAPSDANRVTMDGGSYLDVSPADLAVMLKAKDFTLVNVHVPYDGEIVDTDLFIPFDQIAGHISDLPPAEAKIVLYCRSGSMSASAAEALVTAGYTQVLNLAGGMNAWRAAGFPLAGGD
jgi:phage shock protein E